MTPPSSMAAPTLPASVAEKPRGATMSATHCVIPLKTPIPMKIASR